MTPLHLAAVKHKLNSAHLLVEAGADRNALNEARQRPIDLCGNDPPMKALLGQNGNEDKSATQTRSITRDAQVLTAAKDLLESTLVPVTAAEETIILACQKATDEANKVEKAKTDEYSEIQRALSEHKRISDEFKDVITQVEEYRNLLAMNRDNVSNMGTTLAETQREVTTKLQSKRTANAEKRERISSLDQRVDTLKNEYESVTAELEEIERKAAELRKRKAELEDEIERTEDESTTLKDKERSESRNETDIAVHEESLQRTRTLIEKGDTSLNSLQDSTSNRLLSIGMEYANFLRKYMVFVHELCDQFDYKIRTMENRIEEETRNYDEVSKLRLKMDSSKLTALIAEYKSNLARFQRRKDKVIAIQDSLNSDFAIVKQLVGEFGRELEPLD
ncbi:hypothetical protein TRFO_06931 [Tritrichomonas foetus]|uniref:Uncharacterized protein n=1 Tax=Tritrichomonas foetus TaxID=1144522 RepID=A0A1J4JUR3_9EUKA|nr:hypothetical protein TRFO_06931 [Tritrichomonas foetus]|eukprot:OHT02881.1 hypothetical protein TRFO_06931 [Tritrichomonas foetus]